MGSHLSIAEALAQMEAKIAHHEQQQDHPVEQEAHHAGQKAAHEAETRKAVERYEAFKAVSADVGEMLADAEPASPPPASPAEKVATKGWRWLSHPMSRVIEGRESGEIFRASAILDERSTSAGATSSSATSSRAASRPGAATGAPWGPSGSDWVVTWKMARGNRTTAYIRRFAR